MTTRFRSLAFSTTLLVVLACFPIILGACDAATFDTPETTDLSSPDAPSASAAASKVEFMSFPLRGYTAYTAPISAVLDHSLPVGNCPDGTVVAYTGETGRSANGKSKWTYPASGTGCVGQTLYGYRNAAGTRFSLNGQFQDSGEDRRYLFYDGHTGYDYPTPNGTAVYAVASGKAYEYPDGVEVVHDNGYSTFYLHLSRRSITNGQKVTTSTKLGETGSGHLHLTVKKGTLRADPYGWQGPRNGDPLKVDGADNVRLWK